MNPRENMTGALLIWKLEPAQASRLRDDLIDLLVDAVESGAQVNFMWPMTREKAARYWDAALLAHAAGDRIILMAEREGRIEGTVSVIPANQENQPFRGEISKMLVHRRARRAGIGQALMEAAEQAALDIGRTVLLLDTATGSAGERLYARCGWTKLGEVPGIGFDPDGTPGAASYFYKHVTRRSPKQERSQVPGQFASSFGDERPSLRAYLDEVRVRTAGYAKCQLHSLKMCKKLVKNAASSWCHASLS